MLFQIRHYKFSTGASNSIRLAIDTKTLYYLPKSKTVNELLKNEFQSADHCSAEHICHGHR